MYKLAAGVLAAMLAGCSYPIGQMIVPPVDAAPSEDSQQPTADAAPVPDAAVEASESWDASVPPDQDTAFPSCEPVPESTACAAGTGVAYDGCGKYYSCNNTCENTLFPCVVPGAPVVYFSGVVFKCPSDAGVSWPTRCLPFPSVGQGDTQCCQVRQ